jgi:(p)ppGpp synthase/HD superfamily hydrolase
MVNMKNIERPESAYFLHVTARFTRAIDYARQVHVNYRKGTIVPYMAHLIGVASLVMGESGYVNFPVTEDMVIGALLHDAAEDEGGWPRLRDIKANFGKEVAKIVEGCTDSFEEDSSKKLDWKSRKTSYIERLWTEPEATLLVSAADKLYSARAILEDYRKVGPEVWSRFKRGRNEQLWYFAEISKVFDKRGSNRLTEELKRVTDELAQLSAGEL